MAQKDISYFSQSFLLTHDTSVICIAYGTYYAFRRIVMAYDVRAIANEFLNRAKRDGYFLTNMHLQKLSYIAHGWGLALLNDRLIEDVPQAWKHGPVYPELYLALRRYGPGNVLEPIRERDADVRAFVSGNPESRGKILHAALTDEEKNLLEATWRNYRKYSAFQLSEMTHRPNTPWSEIYDQGLGCNAPIPNHVIQTHYREMIDDQ